MNNFFNIKDINWKWIIISSLIIFSVNFFTGFVIGQSLKLAGLNDLHNFTKVMPFLTLISYTIPFVLITVITLILKFNLKDVLYISILFTILGTLENFIFGFKPFTFLGFIFSLIIYGVLFSLGKLFSTLILKVSTKLLNRKT